MPQTIQGNLYDYPKYYDLVYGSDWKAEFDFLLACFEEHARVQVRRVFEPACGTGRLLYGLAKRGFKVEGIDLNPKAVAFSNQRFQRHGRKPTAWVMDRARAKRTLVRKGSTFLVGGVPVTVARIEKDSVLLRIKGKVRAWQLGANFAALLDDKKGADKKASDQDGSRSPPAASSRPTRA